MNRKFAVVLAIVAIAVTSAVGHFKVGAILRGDFELEAIARRFFSAHEQSQLAAVPAEEKPAAFFRCWTRKEAYIKATGDGLSLPLSQFDVSLEAGEQNALLAARPPRDSSRWNNPSSPGRGNRRSKNIGMAARMTLP